MSDAFKPSPVMHASFELPLLADAALLINVINRESLVLEQKCILENELQQLKAVAQKPLEDLNGIAYLKNQILDYERLENNLSKIKTSFLIVRLKLTENQVLKVSTETSSGIKTHEPVITHIANLEVLVATVLREIDSRRQGLKELVQSEKEREMHGLIGQLGFELERTILDRLGGDWAKFVIHSRTGDKLFLESFTTVKDAYVSTSEKLSSDDRRNFEYILAALYPDNHYNDACDFLEKDIEDMKQGRKQDEYPRFSRSLMEPLISGDAVYSRYLDFVLPNSTT